MRTRAHRPQCYMQHMHMQVCLPCLSKQAGDSDCKQYIQPGCMQECGRQAPPYNKK